MSEKSGAGFIRYIAAVAGFLLSDGVGAAIATAWAVPADSFLGRSAQAGAPIGGHLAAVWPRATSSAHRVPVNEGACRQVSVRSVAYARLLQIGLVSAED